jgi:hypothetical protein
MFSDMLRNQLLAVLGVHDIESEGHALLTVLFNSLLDPLGTKRQLAFLDLSHVSLLFLLLG